MAEDGARSAVRPEVTALVGAARVSLLAMLERLDERNAVATLQRVGQLALQMGNAVRIAHPLLAVEAREAEEADPMAEDDEIPFGLPPRFGDSGLVAVPAPVRLNRPTRSMSRAASESDLAARVLEEGLAGLGEFLRLQQRQKTMDSLILARGNGDVALAAKLQEELGLDAADLPMPERGVLHGRVTASPVEGT